MNEVVRDGRAAPDGGAPSAGPSRVGPLAGRSVLIPAAADRAGGPSGLHDALIAAGADVTAARFISVVPPADPVDLDAAARRWVAGEYGWLAFTSTSTVTVWAARVAALRLTDRLGRDGAWPSRIAAVGPATARAVRAAGWPVDLQPASGGSARELAAAWPAPGLPPRPVLLPRSDRAAPTLPDALTAAGYRVDTVVAYRTVTHDPDPATAERLRAGEFAAVLFTSPSTVQALGGVRPAAGTVIGAIGRPTADAVRAAGLALTFTATAPTPAAFVDGLLHHLDPPSGTDDHAPAGAPAAADA